MFLVILSVVECGILHSVYQKRSRWAAQYSDKWFNKRKPIQWKPLVITTCRHCSWKPNDDSQLSHFGRQSGLQILKRQTSRRWLASYRSWEPNDDRSSSHYDCQSGLPVMERQTSKRSVTSWFSTMRGMQHRTTGGKNGTSEVIAFGWQIVPRTAHSNRRWGVIWWIIAIGTSH